MSRRSSHRPFNPSIMKSPVSFVATLLVLYFAVPLIVFPFINALGGIGEIVTDLIELLPFGHLHYWLAVEIINSIAGQAVNYSAIGGVFTVGYVVQELAEGIFTVIIYEAGCKLFEIIMGLDQDAGWIKLKRMAVNIAVAIVSACLAPALINFIFSNMGSFSTGWKVAISSLVSTILLGGAVGFFLFLKGLSIGAAIAFVALKFVAVGFVRLALSYVCIFLILLCAQNGIFAGLIGGVSGLLGVALILAGIELMISSAFK